jgi:4'-phosphopantetheinyl transferase
MDVYWLGQTETDVPADNDWLSAGETARLGTMRFPKRRSDWRLGRWTAKRALAYYLNAPADSRALAKIEIRPAASGAPEVFVANRSSIARISLSHSSGTAMCAIAAFDAALGCDLERVEPRSEAFVADYFTDAERALVARAPAASRCGLVTLLWSAKESTLKALHEGLRLDTRSVIVSLPEGIEPLTLDEMTGVANPDGVLAQHRSSWQPLEVHCTGNEVFHGWWRQAGKLLRTLVAAPAPYSPIALGPDTD